jgi:hypothetical protein
MPKSIIQLESRAAELLASLTDETPVDEASRIETEHKQVLEELGEAREQRRREICRANGLDYERFKEMDDTTLKTAALDAAAKRTSQQQTFPHAMVTGGGYDDPAVRTRAMGEALFHRIQPSHQPSEAAREFVGLTIPEMARRCLEYAGERTTGMGPAALVTRGLHTTSDFPQLLGDTVGRSLRMAYTAAPSAIKRLARETSAPDFKMKHRLTFSEAPRLEKVNETGEFRRGTFEESGESYKIDTFGKVFGISRQALVNDNLGAFDLVPRKLGQAASAFEAKFLVDLIESNPVMSDSNPLFDAAHGNVDASGAPINLESLGAARLAMRRQVGLTGELISVTPRYLLVPPELETSGQQMVATLVPNTVDQVNPWVGQLEVIVEPRLSENLQWYVIADASEVDGLEYAYLEGEAGPQIDTRAGFDVDGTEIRVRLDFGAGFIDHRGWYRNVGAENGGTE